MASVPAASTTNTSTRGDRGGSRSRGRGSGGRGGSRDHQGGRDGQTRGSARSDGSTQRGPRSAIGGQRGGRGGQNTSRNQDQDLAPPNAQEPATSQPPPQPGGSGVFGDRLTRDAAASKGEIAGTEEAVDDDAEGEVCFICASPVEHWSVAPCNHRTCHICALRLRALYKNKACAHCRTEAATVIFTDENEKRYEEYQAGDFFRTDNNLGINYEKEEIFEDTVLLLRYNCPDETCDTACLGWPTLHNHVRSKHNKVMCDLCTRNKKVFTHEHELFTQQDLKRHEKFGDDKPGAIDQSGFKGHPECGFCRQRFYGEDELYAHCRDRHERCHVCDRQQGQHPVYFQNYAKLEEHFSEAHFPCLNPECQEQKFVVFGSEMDLKAHQLEKHPDGLSKDARRDARRVDISQFNYRPQYEEPTRRGGRRAGRGRDPNAEGTLAISAAHMSRAELAHQREREIHSAQSVTSRSFGGQLTQSGPPAQVVRPPAASPRPAVAQPVVGVAPLSPRSAAAMSPQEQARKLRHEAVVARAATLLRNDTVKMNEFRERISTYRQGGIGAGDLIDAFFALFDTSSDELGKLVKELADIFEKPEKRESLLRAWGDWKAINEDYPSLPGPAGANATATGLLGQSVGAQRVLKLKSSTTRSSQSAAQRHASWGSAASSSSSNPFPALPPRSGLAIRGAAPPAPTPGWLSLRPATGAASQSSSARPSPQPSRVSSSVNLPRADAFPALPVAKKPTSTVFTPGYRGNGVIRVGAASNAVNPWAASDASVPTLPPAEDASADQGRKKGKKGKKQVVFAWG